MTTYSVFFDITVDSPALAIVAIAVVVIVALTNRRESRSAVHAANVAARDAAPARRSRDEQDHPRWPARTRRWVGRVAEEAVVDGFAGLLTNLFGLVLRRAAALFTGG